MIYILEDGGNRMKKYITMILIFVVTVSTGFYGCSGEKEQEEPKKTLKIATFYSSKDQGELYSEIAKAYEKTQKNLKVEVVNEFGDEDKLKEALTKEGDISLIGVTRSQLIEFAKSGLLKDLSEFVEQKGFEEKLYNINLAYGKYNGKVYGIGDLPMSIEWFYNTEIFEKNNLSEPKNLTELLAVCNALKKKNITPIGIGAMDGWTLSTLFGMITAQTTGITDLTSYYGSNAESFKKVSSMNEAFNVYGQLISSDAIPKNSSDLNYAASVDDFVKGKSAILPAGSWANIMIEDKKPTNFKYKVFTSEIAFVKNPISRFSATAGQVLVIPNNTKNSKDAEAFLEFMFSEEGQKIIVEKGYVSPVRMANKKDKEIKNSIMDHLEKTDDSSVMLIDNLSKDMGENLTRVLQDIQEGRLKPNEGWSRVIKLTFQQ